ncbi:MAG: hypothetical protein GX160_03565 [Clostridiales bacterium]|nr:hypothetical protein [Clostridiales bacterium]
MNDRFDDKIKKALEYGTDNALSQKEEVWNAIKAKTYFLPKGVSRMSRKRKKQKPIFKILAASTVAAALLLTFLVETEPGKAAIDKIKEMFEPQKNIVQDLEGNKEETVVELNHSKIGYVIYVDKEMYDLVKSDEADRIVAKHQGEGLPEVFMEITQIVDKAPSAVAADIENQLKTEFPIVENRGQVSDPIDGRLIRATTGNEWNDKVVVYYLVDNTQGGTFVIKQQYFFEASEGHGSRFYHMLKEFEIVKE